MTELARRQVLAVMATAAAIVASCKMPEQSPPGVIGMCVHMIDSDPVDMARQFDLMARMHVTFVRVDFNWAAVEGTRGQYDWSYTDRIVEHAAARGMEILALLSYTPGWARPPGTTTHDAPTRTVDFAEFARAAAKRYLTRGVRSWEIWNEPNSSDHWHPRPDVNRYGELFTAAAAAIRNIDPDATVMTGGLTRGGDTPDGRRISQITFLSGLYRNGAAQVADAIAIHPYSFPYLPSGSAEGIEGTYQSLPAIRALTRRYGDTEKKIWITEFGAPTGTDPEAMSERDQATSLLEARRLAESWEWVGPLIFYEVRDGGTDPTDLEQNFGVVRADMTPKDAAKALMR